MSTLDPIRLVMSHYTSTTNKHRYKPTAIGDADALSDLDLSIDAIGEDPPRTIEVSIRLV